MNSELREMNRKKFRPVRLKLQESEQYEHGTVLSPDKDEMI